MIDVNFLENFVESFHVKNEFIKREYFSAIGFFSEFRTYGLNLPRQSGKTTALEAFAAKRSALRFNGTKCKFVRNLIDNTPAYLDIVSIGSFRGMRSNGMKYQCIVADEFHSPRMVPDARDYFWQSVIDLHNADMLTDDFFILYAGTAR